MPARVVRMLLASALVSAAAVAAAPAAGAADSGRNGLAARLGGGAHVVAGARGLLRFAGAAAHHAGARPNDITASAPAETAARGWLRHYGNAFGITDEAHGLQARSTVSDHVGHIVRFGQTIGGVPVVGGGVVVALDDTNRLLSIDSRVSSASVSTVATLPSSTATRVAVRRLERHTGRTDLTTAQPRLEILDPAVLGGGLAPQLVWTVGVMSRDRFVRHTVYVDATRGTVVLDLDDNPRVAPIVVCSGGSGNVLATDPSCKDTGAPNPVVASSTGSPGPASSSGDSDTYNAYRFAGAVDDFYRTLFNRDSLDNAGMTLRSTVHFCLNDGSPSPSCPMQNAFWDGSEMVYGNGFAGALDVVGHEMTHGVTEHMANLFDYYQSGAINESISDVMGELIQQVEGPQLNAAGQTDVYDPNNRWSIAENLGQPSWVRHMDNPTKDSPSDPDSMISSFYNSYSSSDPKFDQGGVHANDGVGNKTAYLITDGTGGVAFNGVTVPGMSTQAAASGDTAQQTIERDVKTANVYYRLESLMNSSTDYADLANLLPAACNQLVGAQLPLPVPFPAGTTTALTTADCQSVTAATQATRLSTPAAGAGAAIPVAATVACTNGGKPTTLRLDHFDTSSPQQAGYTKGHAGADGFGDASFGNWWWSKQNIDDYGQGSTLPTYAHSGDGVLWGDDADPTTFDPNNSTYDREDSWAISPAISVRPGTFLNFAHAWDFDSGPGPSGPSGPTYNFDGGVVEYSANGGAWTDARGLFTAGGYNGVISITDGVWTPSYFDPNPLAGRHGFVGSSHGWTASRMDLSSLAGKSVHLRWRIGADDAMGGLGWFIDDVNVYSCNPTSMTLTAPTSVVYGHTAALHAHLVRSGTTSVVAGAPVQLYQRRHGTTTWSAVGTTRATDSSGNVAFSVKPTLAMDFAVRALAVSTSSYAPSNLAARAVNVAFGIAAHASATTVRHGHAVTITGTVVPNAYRARVSVQVYDGGKWRTVTGPVLTAKSTFTFRFTPKRAETLRVRLWKAGTSRYVASSKITLSIRVT